MVRSYLWIPKPNIKDTNHLSILGDETVIRVRKRPAPTSSGYAAAKPIFGKEFCKELAIPKLIDLYNHHMNGVDRADQLRSYYNTKRKKYYKTWKPLWHFLLDAALTNSYLIATHPPPGELKRYPKKGHAQFLKDLANGLFQHSKMKPRNSTIETNRNVHKAKPLQDLIRKDLNPSQHTKVNLSEPKPCKACAVAGRKSTNPKIQRKPLGDLSANTLRATAQANEGRASRIKRTRWGCQQCNINLCEYGTCWMEHIRLAIKPEQNKSPSLK
jgi:hypothetical protein